MAVPVGRTESEESFIILKRLCSENAHSSVVFHNLLKLFQSLETCETADISRFESLAGFIRVNSARYPTIMCQAVLQNLNKIRFPKAFIESIPMLLSSAPPLCINEAVENLLNFVQTDYQHLLSVLIVIADLPIPTSMLEEIVRLGTAAISMVEESEFPHLFRVLLRIFAETNASELVLKLFAEANSLSSHTAALIVDCLWEVLPSSQTLSGFVLAALGHDFMQISIVSLSTLLILLTEAPTLRKKCELHLQFLLKNSIFPFEKISQIISFRGQNEVWDRMLPSVWHVCLWLLDLISIRCIDVEIKKSFSIFNSVLEDLHATVALVEQLYRSVPSLQEGVAACLCSRSFLVRVTHNKEKRWCYEKESLIEHFPQLGHAVDSTLGRYTDGPLRQGGGRGSQHRKSIQLQDSIYPILSYNWIYACGLKFIAHDGHLDVGSKLLAFLMGRLEDGGETTTPPHAVVVSSLIESIVQCSTASATLENTLLILIQKLLSCTSNVCPFMMNSLLSSTKYSLYGQHKSNDRMGGGYSDCNIFCLSSSVIGLQLGLCMLARVPAILEVDLMGIIGWFERSFSSFQDSSFVYALHFLSRLIDHLDVTSHIGESGEDRQSHSHKSILRSIECSIDHLFQTYSFCESLRGNEIDDEDDMFFLLLADCFSRNVPDKSSDSLILWKLSDMSEMMVDQLTTGHRQEHGTIEPGSIAGVFWSLERAALLLTKLQLISIRKDLGSNFRSMAFKLSMDNNVSQSLNGKIRQESSSKKRDCAIHEPIAYLEPCSRDILFIWNIQEIYNTEDSFEMTHTFALRLAWERLFLFSILLGISHGLPMEPELLSCLLCQAVVVRFYVRLASEIRELEDRNQKRLRKVRNRAEGEGGSILPDRRRSLESSSAVDNNLHIEEDLAINSNAIENALQNGLSTVSMDTLHQSVVNLFEHIEDEFSQLTSHYSISVLSLYASHFSKWLIAGNISKQSIPTVADSYLRDCRDLHGLFFFREGLSQEVDAISPLQMESLKKLFFQFVKSIPIIMKQIEHQRIRSSESSAKKRTMEPALTTDLFGDELDLDGLTLLLGLIAILISTIIDFIQDSAGGDLDKIESHSLLSWFQQDGLYLEDFPLEFGIVGIFQVLEFQACHINNAALSMLSLDILTKLSHQTLLQLRCAQIAWKLQHMVFSASSNFELIIHQKMLCIPQNNEIDNYLGRNFNIDLQLQQLMSQAWSRLDVDKVGSLCAGCLRIVYSQNGQPNGRGELSRFSIFLHFWLTWYNYETDERKVLGVASLFFCLFKFHSLNTKLSSERIKSKGTTAAISGNREKVNNINSIHSKYVSTLPKESGVYFPSIDVVTFRAHFEFAVSLLPSLFFISGSDFLIENYPAHGGINIDSNFGIYENLVFVSQLYVFIFKEMEKASTLTDLKFYFQTSTIFIRLIGCILRILPHIIDKVVSWRSYLERVSTEEQRRDEGCVELLGSAMAWVQRVIECSIGYLETLKSKVLEFGNITILKRVAGVPRVVAGAETLMTRLQKLATVHSFEIVELDGSILERRWSQFFDRVNGYNSFQNESFAERVTIAMWAQMQVRELGARVYSRGVGDAGISDPVMDDQNLYQFVAVSSNNITEDSELGWGLY